MMKDQIEINDLTVFTGRNIYSHRPVIKMIVDIGKYGENPTKDIPGFNDKLLELFPGLAENYCSLGYVGGFLERLKEGTYLAHVLEHLILEMQFMLGYDVSLGKTRAIKEPSLYNLIFEYKNEVCGLECGKNAVYILNCLLKNENIDIGDEFFRYLKKVTDDAELGPSTSAIVNEAKKRGIPATRIGSESLVRLGYGRHSRLIESTMTDATPCICADISCNKQLTKFLLDENQLPVPYGKVVYSEISALMAAEQIGMPVVIKPFDGNQGKGVHLNLKTAEQIKAAFNEASRYSNGIIVEKYVEGRDYRILVVGGRVSAVAERLPASVTGDGIHTIAQLIDTVNMDPARGAHHEKPLTKIKIDDTAKNVLKKLKLNEQCIPAKGQTVKLRENGNLSTGGIAIDCTDIIHPDNAEIAVRAAQAVGIDIAGVDVVTKDISRSVYETGGVIVEVNTAPGIRMHLFPSIGQPQNVAEDIVDMLFPDEDSTDFPIVSVTGTNGKTTVARVIAHVLTQTGKAAGLTSTSGTYIDGRVFCKGDNSGPRSARSLLANRSIDAAVLETARGGIVREGLGYDLADIGVITNITEDHLGTDSIETLEDLAFVKSLVAEAVKNDGYAVLNAADKMTPYILSRIKSRVILFAKDKKAFDQYENEKFTYVTLQEGVIVVRDGRELTEIAQADEIPITCGGKIECNVENCLAAAAALYGLGVSARAIKKGLLSFEDNRGRFSKYDHNGIDIILDYGHNPAGYEQAIKALRNFEHNKLIGVIGMPGDRPDSAARDIAKQCADAFDSVYIKEDVDLRGRAKGEVAKVLYDSITGYGMPLDRAEIILDELDAFKRAVSAAQEGDIVIVFYEKLSALEGYLEDIGAQKVLTETKQKLLV